jgi:hypothetical protein
MKHNYTVFNKEVPVVKTKVISFQVKEPIRSRTYIYRKVIEQLNRLKYSGHCTKYEHKKNYWIANFRDMSFSRW